MTKHRTYIQRRYSVVTMLVLDVHGEACSAIVCVKLFAFDSVNVAIDAECFSDVEHFGSLMVFNDPNLVTSVAGVMRAVESPRREGLEKKCAMSFGPLNSDPSVEKGCDGGLDKRSRGSFLVLEQ